MKYPLKANQRHNSVMKLWIKMALLLCLLLVPKLWAQGVARTNQEILDDEETGGRGRFHATAITDDNNNQGTSQMERITDKFPDVKAAYDSCNVQREAQTLEGKIEDCIWQTIPANIQADIFDYLEEEQETLKENPKAQTAATGAFRSTKSQTTRKLQDYLKERLQETLYQQDPSQGVKILSDHAQFYDLYKSQIGQNVIRITSDVCMYANIDGSLPGSLTSRGAQENKKENMKNLGTINTTPSEPRYAGKPKAYETFDKCLTGIPTDCKDGNKHACKVLAYMEEAKKGIKDIDDVSKELQEYHQNSLNKSFATIRSREKLGNQEEVAKLTLIASGEIKDAEIDEVAQEEAKVLEECAANPQASDECELYLTDQDSKASIEAEFIIREKAKEEKVKTALANDLDVEAVKKVLEEEGLSEEQIARYLASAPKDGRTHAEDIKKRYEEKRIAVIDELNKRIKVNQESADPATAITAAFTGDTPETNQNTFENMQEKTQNKAQKLEESIHFANVVSSFISVGDEGNVNTNALANELANSSFEDNTPESLEAGLGVNHKQQLEAALQSAPNQAPDDQLPMLEAGNLEEIIYQLPNENNPSGE